jgi:hypothetical protein
LLGRRSALPFLGSRRMETVKVYVYPDGMVYEEPPSWASDDYEVREAPYCEECDELMEPHYAEPFTSCSCKTIEWYR